MGPETASRAVVLELGELDLHLPSVIVVGEDVEDHRGAVDHGHLELRLEVALLAGNQLVVDRHDVRVRRRLISCLRSAILPRPR